MFRNTLDSRAAVQCLVTFYVREYNVVTPHGALDWWAPDEVPFGRGMDVVTLSTAADDEPGWRALTARDYVNTRL